MTTKKQRSCRTVGVPEPWEWCHIPPGMFRGKNFMTPEVIGFARANVDGLAVYVEISKERSPYWSQTVGRDENGGPIYGLTFERPGGAKLDPDPSRCVHSQREIVEALREVAGSEGEPTLETPASGDP